MTTQLQSNAASNERITITRSAKPERLSLRNNGPQQVLLSFWQHRELIRRLVVREVASRYRGSIFGLAWSVVTPLMMLAVYTFVFSVVFEIRWGTDVGSRTEFALVLFSGLIVLQFFSDCIGRAPGLLLENPTYIKKVVFPLECLAWVVLGSAFFNALVSIVVLLAAHFALVGAPPLTALLMPLVLLPLAVLLVGGVWFISSIGLFLRDVRHVVSMIMPIMLFASPIFYPMSAVPEQFRVFLYLNPLTPIIENARDVVLYGKVPDAIGMILYILIAYLVAWLGLVWFSVTKRGFADVV